MSQNKNCKSCSSTNLIFESCDSHLICVDCGLVLEDVNIVNELEFQDAGNGGKVVQGVEVGMNQTYATVPSYGVSKPRHGSYSWEQQSHQRDLAQVLQRDVFKLGRYYVQIADLLFIKPPPIDPSWYLTRFASTFGLGAKTFEVVKDATRLVRRMKCDWLEFGRRPAGISGACLLIAARMNHFSRSIEDAANLVKVAPITIKKRLREFASTASSDLTVNEFREKWLDLCHLPPSFQTAKGPETALPSPPLSAIDSSVGTSPSPTMITVSPSDQLQTPTESSRGEDHEDEELSDSELDKGLDQYLLTCKEVEIKTEIWERENEEYYQEQQLRLSKRVSRPKSKTSLISKSFKDYNYGSETPSEATERILSTKSIPKSIEPYLKGGMIKKLFEH